MVRFHIMYLKMEVMCQAERIQTSAAFAVTVDCISSILVPTLVCHQSFGILLTCPNLMSYLVSISLYFVDNFRVSSHFLFLFSRRDVLSDILNISTFINPTFVLFSSTTRAISASYDSVSFPFQYRFSFIKCSNAQLPRYSSIQYY